MILPWITLAAMQAAFYTRLSRGQLLDTLGEDYIRAARAKGLSERRVVFKHGVRAALTPVVSQLGVDVGQLLGGVVVVANIIVNLVCSAARPQGPDRLRRSEIARGEPRGLPARPAADPVVGVGRLRGTNVADLAIEGASARFAIVVPAILVTITGLAYALALRPRVIAEPSGLTIVNPFRDHHVPWAAIQAVDTGDWVRVHYAPGEAAADPPGPLPPARRAARPARPSPAGRSTSPPDQAPGRPGWIDGRPGLARPAMPPRTRRVAGAGMLAVAGQEPGYAEDSRLPEEARYLASLPAAKAIAVRLDTRAGRERAHARQADPGRAVPENAPVTARWAWPRPPRWPCPRSPC